MPGEKIEISYEVFVKGIERMNELTQRNKELEAQTHQYTQKTNEAARANERHDSSIKKASQAVRSFRREMFIFSLTAAAVIGTLKALASASESLGIQMEKAGDSTFGILRNLGNLIAYSHALDPLVMMLKGLASATAAINKKVGVPEEMGDGTRPKQIFLGDLQAKILALEGKSAEAKRLQLTIEKIKMHDALRKFGADAEKAWKQYEDASKRAIDLAELGLKSLGEIAGSFKRDIVGAFKGGTSDVLFNFLQGERQSGADILKTFTTVINRAVSDAISESLFTSLFRGGNIFTNFKDILMGKRETSKLQEETNKLLKDNLAEKLLRIQESVSCVCDNIGRLGGGGRFEGTITPAKVGALGKIGAIANLTGALASAGALASRGAGITVGQGDPEGIPGFRRMGGWAGYQGGGEVPIVAHRGEFVVNRTAAQANKGLLEDINAGGFSRSKRSPMYVFIKANDAQSFDAMLSTPAARDRMELQINRALMANGTFRRLLKEFG